MAVNNNLNNSWEWNLITGDPFTPAEDSPNARYCPTIEDMGELVRSSNATGNDLRRRLLAFMTSNETRLTMHFDAHVSAIIRRYLSLLRSLNFNKIHLDYVVGGTLHMDKLPRDTPFHGEPDGIVNQFRGSKKTSVYGLVADINHNAMLGWLGAGTYPCHYPPCNLCNVVGRNPTVNLGPHGQLQLTKRAYCFTKNAVYVGICLQCEEEESFACYIGESRNGLVRRCAEHHNSPCNTGSILHNRVQFPTIDHKRAEVRRVIAAGVDPDDVLRDWFSHVTEGGIHPGQQRMSVVDIIPHPFLRKTRERYLVAEHMFQNGDFDYLGMGRGCLNTYPYN